MSGKTWFSRIFGFVESESYDENRKNFRFDPESHILTSIPNGKSFFVGLFECLSVENLLGRLSGIELPAGRLVLKELVGDARSLHLESDNMGAVFMVASQFNALEMVGPSVTPEKGITDYIRDRTQGPACALACPAATVFRNYMVNGTGQGKGKQLNMLSDVESLLDTAYWKMANGYCLPLHGNSMAELGQQLNSNPALAERMRSSIKVAIHWDTETTLSPQHRVCQVFCSALPVSYCHVTRNRTDWAPFACLVLEAAYTATLAAAALLAAQRGTRVRVFLTKLGGGAFGNSAAWIQPAIDAACRRFESAPLDVFLVKFGSSAM